MSTIEVDKDDNAIGLRPSDDFYTGKYIHRSVHLILFNSQGQILLQKRAPNKEWYPNLISYSVSGTVENETYEECILRETEEEIGISTPAKYLFKHPYFDTLDKAWHAVFLGKSDNQIKPDGIEMTEVIWIDPDELKNSIANNPDIYVPHFIIGMNKYFTEFDKTEK